MRKNNTVIIAFMILAAASLAVSIVAIHRKRQRIAEAKSKENMYYNETINQWEEIIFR